MDLQIVRFTQPAMMSLMPRKLFEQIVEADEGVDLGALMRAAAEGMLNPYTFFFGVIDPDAQAVVGFLWTVHSTLKNRLVVFFMSVLPEYQQSNILHVFFALCKDIVARYKLDTKLELYSLHGHIAKAYGGVPSKTTIWEFDTTSVDYGIRRRDSQEKEIQNVAQTEVSE